MRPRYACARGGAATKLQKMADATPIGAAIKMASVETTTVAPNIGARPYNFSSGYQPASDINRAMPIDFRTGQDSLTRNTAMRMSSAVDKNAETHSTLPRILSFRQRNEKLLFDEIMDILATGKFYESFL